MEKIYSITEAFSIQPITIKVGERILNKILNEIKEETIYINGELYEIYAGRTSDGKLMFHYLKKSVNVHYTTD